MSMKYSGIVVAVLLVCVGCAQAVTVDVSGKSQSSDPIPQHVTYTVMPTNEVKKDPAFPAYAALVSKEMEARGYKKTTDKTAHLGVYLAYGSSTAAAAAPMTPNAPMPQMSAGGGMGPSGAGGGGSYGMATSTPSDATGMPRYKNQLVIVVVDLQKTRETGAPVELWRGEAMNTNSSNDLSQFAPIMIDAAFQHFGETTSISVRHEFTDEESTQIRESK